MILKFMSRLGKEVTHEIIPNARNWYCTTKDPRIEFWVSEKNHVYLIAGNFQWKHTRGRNSRGAWKNGSLHYYAPPIYLGDRAKVQFESYEQAIDLHSLFPYVEPPYPNQVIEVIEKRITDNEQRRTSKGDIHSPEKRTEDNAAGN